MYFLVPEALTVARVIKGSKLKRQKVVLGALQHMLRSEFWANDTDVVPNIDGYSTFQLLELIQILCVPKSTFSNGAYWFPILKQKSK